MAELQEQLQAILGNPEAMSQITAIARALTGESAPESPPAPPPEAQDVEFVPVVEAPAPPPEESGSVLVYGSHDYTRLQNPTNDAVAEKIARLSRVVRIAIQLWKEGEEHV